MSNKYSPESYIQPFWSANPIINESALPLGDEDGGISPITLMFDIERIIELRSSHLDTLYTEGKDYVVADGKLVILPDGDIPVMKFGDYFFPEKEGRSCFSAKRGGYIYFAEGSDLHDRQIAVTYTHNGENYLPVPQDKSRLLPTSAASFGSAKKSTVLVFGDSISTGANSSGVINTPPYADDWCNMVTDSIKKKYANPAVELVNKAVGGTVSDWGAENAAAAAECKPDLAIIGFGMNDGTCRAPAEKFIENIKSIIASVSAVNPACEFVLISTMLANDATLFDGSQEDYLPALLSLEREGVAVANVTEVHKALLTRKKFCDMSGNNINHPNDFLARVYAQVILKTLGWKG